nr:long-chain fatty acid--CoA ligase [Pseudenhygromyxa sp. WMMC2535]
MARLFLARARKNPEQTALRHKLDGVWRPMSWRAWEHAAREIAAGLIAPLGVRPGERVAIMAGTRVEWALCDVAVALCGAVSVPIYATSTGAEIEFVLRDAGCEVALFEHAEQLRRLIAHGRPPCLRHEIVMDPRPLGRKAAVTLESLDPAPEEVGRMSLDDLRAAGDLVAAAADIEGAVAARGLEDPFTIVYTSGTTGRPKGAVLSHRNLVYEAWAIKNSVAVDRTDQHLLTLPLAHIFARHLLWAGVESGAVTAFAERGLSSAVTDMAEVAPTYVGAVPRFYEKLQLSIEAELARRSRPERKLIELAFETGREVSDCRQRGRALPPLLAGRYRAADKLLFESIRARFGGKLRFFISGAAPLSRETAEFFHAMGLLVLEGYGLTETTGATHVNRPDRFRFGTVGPALPGCEVLIAEGGEILLRGHNVMHGYHGLPTATAAAIDADGWLHTGDVGELDEGFLRITDRLKDIIITAGGKNIAPQKLENRLRARPGIAHVLVTGDRRPHLVALIGLDLDDMLAVAEREGLGCRDYADLARHPRIREEIAAEVDALNRELPGYETIKRFAIPARPFEAELVTPTGKLKRRAVEAHYAELIDGLYRGRRPGPKWPAATM